MPEDKLPTLDELNSQLPTLDDLNRGLKKNKAFSERVKDYLSALKFWIRSFPDPRRY
jgi:hypothetical protein